MNEAQNIQWNNVLTVKEIRQIMKKYYLISTFFVPVIYIFYFFFSMMNSYTQSGLMIIYIPLIYIIWSIGGGIFYFLLYILDIWFLFFFKNEAFKFSNYWLSIFKFFVIIRPFLLFFIPIIFSGLDYIYPSALILWITIYITTTFILLVFTKFIFKKDTY